MSLIFSSFDLLRELQIIDASSRINDAEISQPAITAIQVALIDLLMMYSGLSPSSACGHSSGEIAAAYAAGAITREDAWTISYHRGQCMMPTQSAVKPMGGMIAVDLSAQDAQVYADAQGKNRVRVACMNSPNSTTLSGDRDAILNIQKPSGDSVRETTHHNVIIDDLSIFKDLGNTWIDE